MRPGSKAVRRNKHRREKNSSRRSNRFSAEGSIETALFRIVQEAVNNVIRHAQARHVGVTLKRTRERVTLQVVDDGRGFDAQLPLSGGHVGLWSMRERVEQLGGQFDVRSAPGRGTVVTAVIPL